MPVEWKEIEDQDFDYTSREGNVIITKELAIAGTRVKRGRDWEWYDQDQNRNGTITTTADHDWVVVQWDNGVINTYRVGGDKKFDLYLAKE